MKYANELLVVWYATMCTYILLSSDDSNVYIAFIGLHVFVVGLYKYMQEREGKRRGIPDKQV